MEQRCNYIVGLTSEAGRCQNIHVPRFKFVWPLGLNAGDFNLGGHELGRVLHLEVYLGVGAVHCRGLLHAQVGLQ